MNKPTCSVPPAAQTPKPAVSEVASAPAPAPVVQQGKSKGLNCLETQNKHTDLSRENAENHQ